MTDQELVISTIADVIGASCTCSGRPNRDKNVEMATRIFEGLVKKGML